MTQHADIILDSISLELSHDIVNMAEAGDDMGIANWAKLLMVESEQLKAAARAMVLAAGLAASDTTAALSEEDIPDYIRRQANQTQFARAARGEQTRGQDAARINEPNRDDRRYDDQRRNDDRRYDDRRYDDRRYDDRRYDDRRHYGSDPYWMTRDMQRRMGGGAGLLFNFGRQPDYGYQDYGYPYQQRYPGYQQPFGYQQAYPYRQEYPYQQQQGWYGFADETSPLDGGDQEGWDQYEEPPQQQVMQPPPEQQPAPQPQPPAQAAPAAQPKAAPAPAKTKYTPGPGAMSFKLPSGKAAVFEPYPNQGDLEMARKVSAPTKSVNVAGQNKQIKAYVYELDGVTYVVAQPGQL